MLASSLVDARGEVVPQNWNWSFFFFVIFQSKIGVLPVEIIPVFSGAMLPENVDPVCITSEALEFPSMGNMMNAMMITTITCI